jgi:hypothetical protein
MGLAAGNRARVGTVIRASVVKAGPSEPWLRSPGAAGRVFSHRR